MSQIRTPPEGRRWQPGQAPYAEWLKTLTPEQREAHLLDRRKRKAMREVMRQVVAEYQAQWAAGIHTAAWRVLERARTTGDAMAFMAVWDRIVGRAPDAAQDQAQPLPWQDD